jgi:hypothetical protein
MDFFGLLWHTFLQSDLRLGIPASGSRCNLSHSAQDGLQQLLQMQNLHERLWKTCWCIFWKRICQERKCWKQVGIHSFCLFSAFSASNVNSVFLVSGVFFASEAVSSILSFDGVYLQLNYLV